MNIVVLGLTITSTWGNGHATTYRALLEGLARRGHDVTFLERDVPWYRENQDGEEVAGVDVHLYPSLDALRRTHRDLIRDADAVVVGSYVPDGREVAAWVLDEARGARGFYDIDTPVTLRALEEGTCAYMDVDLLRRFDAVFSFAVGRALDRLRGLGVSRPVPLPCAVDERRYRPNSAPVTIDLGYMGTYSADRQAALESLLVEPARRLPDRRFAVAGSQYPDADWPANVQRLGHVPLARHAAFYCSQAFTLNVTRQDMVANGHSPSVRLFEAAATATPVISDAWTGLEDFFTPEREIVIANSPEDVAAALAMPEADRQAIGERARRRVLAEHTADRRAAAFEQALRTEAA